MFFQEEVEFVEIGDFITENNLDARRAYEWIRLLENEGQMRFKKTPFGRRKLTKKQAKVVLECSRLEEIFGNWKEVFLVIQRTEVYKSAIKELEEDEFKNFRGLKNIVWRKF